MFAQILILLAATAVSTNAAPIVTNTTDELSVARQALRDGLWEIARAHAEKAGDVDDAKLVQLESWAAEDKWGAVSNALVRWANAKGPAFDYYRAVVRGDADEAAKILKANGTPEGLVQAQLYEADRLARSGEAKKAAAIWREICARTNVAAKAFARAASGLGDPALLRRAWTEATTSVEKRELALRLGVVLLKDAKTADEGAALVRSVVRDSPDTPGAREAFLTMADARRTAAKWEDACKLYSEATETWPDTARLASVQEGLGWSLVNLGRDKEALDAFVRMEQLATNDEARATAALKQGDVLTTLNKVEDALATYDRANKAYPGTKAAAHISQALKVRELETKGRELYRTYNFAEAQKTFRQVAKEDPSRALRMKFFETLCLFGKGEDDAAEREAEALLGSCPDRRVRADICLWLAKFKFNRRDWKTSGRLFREASGLFADSPDKSADALLWSAHAALAENNYASVISNTTQIVTRYPATTPARLPALILQGQTLIELARFDEAILVFDRFNASPDTTSEQRTRVSMLRADALFAMGADNPARYKTALEAYRSILFSSSLSPSEKIVVSFKIARVLEKMNRSDEARDQYYTQVVLAYRRERQNHVKMNDDARAAFSKAAFRLADDHESCGRDRQAIAVLDLVATSDSPAAEEARKRINRLSSKGGIL